MRGNLEVVLQCQGPHITPVKGDTEPYIHVDRRALHVLSAQVTKVINTGTSRGYG